MKKKVKTIKYSNQFDPREICKFLGGRLHHLDHTLLKSSIKLSLLKESNMEIEISLFPMDKKIICLLLWRGYEVSYFELSGVEKVWHQPWYGERVVVFEKPSGAQLVIVTDKNMKELGYKIQSYDFKFWGHIVG